MNFTPRGSASKRAYPWEIVHQNGVRKARATCLQCSAVSHVSLAGTSALLPPEVVLKKFRQQGWADKKHGLICGLCACVVRSRVERQPMPEVPITLEEPVMPINKPIPQAAPIVNRLTGQAAGTTKLHDLKELVDVRWPTPKENRLIIGKLEEVFDDETGQYTKPWSDEAVAAHLELPRTMVANIRREAFGDVKPPAELLALQNDILGTRAILDELQKRVDRALKAWTP